MNRKSIVRHTGPLVTNDAEVTRIEARNALLQFDAVRRLIRERGSSLSLTPSDLCSLQAIAVKDIFACAGTFRSGPIGISGTTHRPPDFESVPGFVDEMCLTANQMASDPLSVSAYLMWRLNWIHPFADGNGRTSRAVSYLSLCCGYGMELPGTQTVPDLIAANKKPYYSALDAADAAWAHGKLDISHMQSLIARLLEQQIKTALG